MCCRNDPVDVQGLNRHMAHAVGSSVDSDDAALHIVAATVVVVAVVGRSLPDEVAEKGADAAGMVEAVLEGVVGSWPSRQNIPGSRPWQSRLCIPLS